MLVANSCWLQKRSKKLFQDLVNWVENGVKPLGDNFLDPDEVADSDFGCEFTDGPHTFPGTCLAN